jgi:hypothetical protein
MTTVPPNINPNDDVTYQAMTNQIRQASHDLSDYLNRVVAYMHPMAVTTLARYGLDGTGRFGIGSTASKAADAFCNPLQRAAQNFVDGGQLVSVSLMEFNKGVWIPYQMAKRQMEQGAGSAMLRGANSRL